MAQARGLLRLRWPQQADLTLATLAFGLFIVGVDYNIVNVALLEIRDDLGAKLSSLQWVFSVFSLVSGSTVLVLGAVADRVGRRRMFVAGVLWFAMSSAVCAAAWSTAALIVARGAQGLGVAMVGTATFGLVAAQYDGTARRHALGFVSAASAFSFVVGPLLGGLVVELADWRWAFLVNVPLGSAAALLALRTIPESRTTAVRGHIDVTGAALFTSGLAALAWFALSGSGGQTASLAIAGVSSVAFVAWERRATVALLPLEVFGRAAVVGPLVVLALTQGAFSGWLVLFSLDMQGNLGMSAMHAGIGFLAEILPFMIGAPLGARLADRIGNAPAAALGCLGVAAGFLEIVAVGHHPTLTSLAPGLFLLGLAGGVITAPLESAALAALPTAYAGIAGGLLSTFRNIGILLGVAALGICLQASIALHDLTPGLSSLARDAAVQNAPAGHARDAVVSAFSDGFGTVTIVAAIAYVAAAAIVLATVRSCEATAAACAPNPLPRAGLPSASLKTTR